MRFLIAMRANTASCKKWRPWACSKLSGSIRSPDPSSVASPQRGRLSLKSVDGSTDNMNRHDRRRFATKKHASVAGLREFTRTADELEALGLLETVEIDPVTGSKRRQITAKGRKLFDLNAQAKHRSKH